MPSTTSATTGVVRWVRLSPAQSGRPGKRFPSQRSRAAPVIRPYSWPALQKQPASSAGSRGAASWKRWSRGRGAGILATRTATRSKWKHSENVATQPDYRRCWILGVVPREYLSRERQRVVTVGCGCAVRMVHGVRNRVPARRLERSREVGGRARRRRFCDSRGVCVGPDGKLTASGRNSGLPVISRLRAFVANDARFVLAY